EQWADLRPDLAVLWADRGADAAEHEPERRRRAAGRDAGGCGPVLADDAGRHDGHRRPDAGPRRGLTHSSRIREPRFADGPFALVPSPRLPRIGRLRLPLPWRNLC